MRINTLQKNNKCCSSDSLFVRPSPLGGVGVFALHDIEKYTRIFCRKSPPVIKKRSEIPPAFLPYCICINQSECLAPEQLDRLEIYWYTNHSRDPNIGYLNGYDPNIAYLNLDHYDSEVALRDIKAGEEILIDYNTFNEPEELKDFYY